MLNFVTSKLGVGVGATSQIRASDSYASIRVFNKLEKSGSNASFGIRGFTMWK